MSRLKLSWICPEVGFKGDGIGESFGKEMLLQGWTLVPPEKADALVFLSDSTLQPGMEPLLAEKASLAWFWGWPPERLVGDEGFIAHAQQKLGLLARVQRVLCPTPDVLDQALALGLGNAALCIPGVDVRALSSDVPARVFEKSTVGFLSRLAPHKQLELLILALSAVPERPNLVVMGSGNVAPYQDYANQLGVNAMFCEPDDAEKVAILKGLTVLVHPSRYEGFGMPPLEALAVGTPVIVASTPHNRFLLRDSANYYNTYQGMVLPEELAYREQALDLARTISELLVNPAPFREQAAYGQRLVRQEYALEAACDRIKDHIIQVVKDRLGVQVRRAIEDGDKDGVKAAYEMDHKRNWDYKAERFDPTWARHWRAKTFIAELQKADAKNMIDIGTSAVYGTIFARAGFEVTAYDLADEALAQSREIATKWKVADRITWAQGWAQHLPFKDGAFDAAVLGEILEHVPDPDVVLKEAWRVVKPGGVVVASTPVGGHHWDPFHIQGQDGGWNDEMMAALLEPYREHLQRLDKIAEDGGEPSCFLFVLKK